MGVFITFEGGEGSGKTTQIKKLSEYITNITKQKVINTREPGGCPEAEKIRKLLVQGDTNWLDKTELLLLNASRAENVEKVIRPALNSQQWVISDRYIDSSIVYQGLAHGNNIKQIIPIIEYATGGLTPDITFYLKIDPDLGLKRSNENQPHEQRFENKGLEFHKKVSDGFDFLANNYYKDRFVTIDGSLTENKIFDIIINTLKTKKFIK